MFEMAAPMLTIIKLFKGSIFLKNRHFFFIQERFNKLVFVINTNVAHESL